MHMHASDNIYSNNRQLDTLYMYSIDNNNNQIIHVLPMHVLPMLQTC